MSTSRLTILNVAALAVVVFPTIVLAGEAGGFTPLTQIPGIENVASQTGMSAFLNNIYQLCIGAAAVLAVLQIMRGGVTYMMGDSITEKKEAKDLIVMSIVGLLLVLSPAIVFGLIDPRILNLNVGFNQLAPGAVRSVESSCQAVTPGRVIDGSLSRCCEQQGLYVHTRRGSAITCETSPQQNPYGTTGDRGVATDGSSYYNVPTTVGTYGIMQVNTDENASCIALRYAPFPTEEACTARATELSIETGSEAGGWYTYYSCFEELYTFRRMTAQFTPPKEFCEAVQSL